MKSQHQAMIDAIVSVKAAHTLNLSKDECREVCEILICDIKDNKVLLSEITLKVCSTNDSLYLHVAKMLNNYLNKKPLASYNKIPKKRHSQSLITDPLLKMLVDVQIANSNNTQKYEEIGIEIMKRKMELQNNKKPFININVIPQHLRHLV